MCTGENSIAAEVFRRPLSSASRKNVGSKPGQRNSPLRPALLATAALGWIAPVLVATPASAQGVINDGGITYFPGARADAGGAGTPTVPGEGLGSSSGIPGALDSGVLAATVTTFGDVNPSPATSPNWDVDGVLNVGEWSAGTMTVTGGGTVTSSYGQIGVYTGAVGTVALTGAGSNWSDNSSIYVGMFGSGTLNVANGASVDVGTNGTLGEYAGSSGIATVSGPGSRWTNDNFLFVGASGNGTLGIENRGLVSAAEAIVGEDAGSVGLVTVTGGGAFDVGGNLIVGYGGTGRLEIGGGGAVTTGNQGVIAYFGGSKGTVTVAGRGSVWNLGNAMQVGRDGTGELIISDGGIVSTTSAAVAQDFRTIGSSTDSSGSVTVTGTGAAWHGNGTLGVGGDGTGTLTVAAGGLVTSATAILGSGVHGIGTATVTGENSIWTNSDVSFVGFFGKGALTVEKGGRATSTTTFIGHGADSTGTVSVTGANSTLANSADLLVGYAGTGTLNIADGGAVTNAVGAIAYAAGFSGKVTVTGPGSTWTNRNEVFVGTFGAGVLDIADGGVVSGTAGFIGRNAGSNGIVTVEGPGSGWTSSSTLYVGNAGTGSLTIAEGGSVTASQVRIAAVAGSAGILNIGSAIGQPPTTAGTLGASEVAFGAGAGTLNLRHTEADYAFAPVISGAGTLNISSGTTRLAADSSGFTGRTFVSGGQLLVEGGLGDGSSTVSVASGGSLGGRGTIGGAVTIADGHLTGRQGRTLKMSALTLGEASTIDAALAAPGGAALFNVTGDLTLDGKLSVADAGGFGAGIYRLIDYGGDLIDRGLEIGGTPAGIAASDFSVQTAIDGEINLISAVGVDLLFWDGGDAGLHSNGGIDGGGGIWDAANANWTDKDGKLNGLMKPMPGFAVFQGAAGTVAVDDSAGAISVTGMQFAADGYVIEGDAIELAGASDESVIRVGIGGPAGANYTATIASSLTGTRSLTKTDLGTLILSGTNSYQGGTTVLQGNLVAAVTGALGTGPVVIDGGDLAFANSASAGNLAIANRTTLAFRQSSSAGAAMVDNMGSINFYDTASAQDATIANDIGGTSFNDGSTAGNATIRNSGGGTLAFYGGATAGAATIINSSGGFTRFLDNSTADGASIVNGTGGVIEISGLTTAGIGIGSISGNGDVYLGSRTLTLGGLGQNDIIGGVIQDGGSAGGTGGSLVKTGAGTLTLTGANIYTGLTTVDGGTMSIGNGGTTGAIVGDAAVGAGGTLAFDRSDSLGYSGALSGAGVFIKHGGGILTLTGDSAAFAGDTAVAAGTLRVDGTLGGRLDVRSGGTLAGAGAVGGAVTVASGGTLAGVQGETLALGALELNSGATIAVALGAPGDVALFDVAGDLTLDGTLDIADAGGFGAGVYRLIDYGGILDDQGLVIGAMPGGVAPSDLIVQTAAAKQVNLVSLSGVDLLFWDGGDPALHNNNSVDGGAGVWDASSVNWTHANGTGNGPMRPQPGFAVFQAAPGAVTVDDADGVVSAAGMQFAADGYRLEGDAIELAGADGRSVIRVGDGTATGAGYTATIASNLTGTSDLVKNDLGTLILTGNNSYQGDTLVLAGALVGDVTAIKGDIANAGTVIFDQTANARFDGAIAGLGGGKGVVVKRGSGVLTLAGTSALDWSIDEGGLFSAGDRFTGNAALGAGASLTFEQAENASYSGVISGEGRFAKEGAAALRLTGDSLAFDGQTEIRAGALQVEGALGGTLHVLNGARLGGNGTVGTTLVASGATIAPGNSIGTLTVAGDITFAAGSIYAVEVDPTGAGSDLIAASGKAFLQGGSVVHIGADGTYDPTATYTILTAVGGIQGTFDAVSSDFAFLDATLGYGAYAVTVTLQRNDISFAEIGKTRNQIATAGGLESLGFGMPIYDAVVQLDEDMARVAFDRLSGEIHGSAKTALVEDSRFVREAATARVRAAFETVASSAAPVVAYQEGGPAPAAAGVQSFAGWGHAFGAWADMDSDGNAAGLDRSEGGFFMGVDGLFADWRIGLLGGYSRSTFDADGRASSGKSSNYHLGIYGGTQRGVLGVRLGATYTFHDIRTDRAIAFTGFTDGASASYGAATGQAFAEAGYRIDAGATSFEPFAGFAYVNQESSVFVEDGGAAALTGESGTTETGLTTLGVRAASVFSIGEVKVQARGSVGWRHAFGDVLPLSIHRFAGSETFTVAGLPIDDDAALIEAGLDLGIGGSATIGASYSGQIANESRQHGFKADFSIRF